MSNTFEEIKARAEDPVPEWQVEVGGRNFTDNLELLEFEDAVNQHVNVTVKLAGVSQFNFAEDAEFVVKKGGGTLFKGVLQEVDPGSFNNIRLIGSGYLSELTGSSVDTTQGTFDGVNFSTIVDALADGVSVAQRTLSTNNNLPSTINVDDFRASSTQLEDLNRLMGEFGVEYFTSFDSNGDPVLNYTDQIRNTSSGDPVGTIKTSGPNQTAEEINQNYNRREGDFDGVIVRGYGDGDDQITARAGNVDSKGDRVFIYTDKTILSDSQAQKRAQELNDSRTVEWREIEVKPNDPNRLYGVGDVLKVDSKDAKLNDNFRVVETYFKIRPETNDFESELTLSNRKPSFISEFKSEQEKTQSQTDYMQGSRNVWGDKESSNATSEKRFTLDFEVPKDVVDVSGKNRLTEIEFNYASEPFKGAAEVNDDDKISASNFDPGVKNVSTEIDRQGIEIERSNISQHAHAVGSSTTLAATGRSFLTDSNNFSFNENIPNNNWQPIGQPLVASNPEDDIAHRIELDIQSISSTANLHFAVVAGGNVANFEFLPQDPTVNETITFDETSSEPEVFSIDEWRWDFGDGSPEETVLTSPGDITHEYSSAGTFTVTLEIYNSNGTKIDDVSKEVEVLPTAQILQSESKSLKGRDMIFDKQDTGSVTLATNNQIKYIGNGDDNVALDYFIGVEDSETGCEDTDIEFLLAKDENPFDFREKLSQKLNQDICQENFYFSFDIGQLTAGEDFNDEGDPFGTSTFDEAGPGVYYPALELQSFSIIDDRDAFKTANDTLTAASRITENLDVNVNPDGNDKQEIEVTVDGVYGEDLNKIEFYIGEDDGSDLGSNIQKIGEKEVTGPKSSGYTFEITPGNDRTVTVDEAELTIGVISTDNDEASLAVDGVSEVVTPGDSFEERNDRVARCRIVHDDEQLEDDNDDPIGQYNAVVIESAVENLNERGQNISEGDYIAHVKLIDENGNEKLPASTGDFETDSFTIELNAPPDSQFSINPTNPDVLDTVQFNDNSTDPNGNNTITKWEWDFGDGTTQTITNSNNGETSKSYSETGTFDVKLTVTDDKGATDSITKQVQVGGQELQASTVAFTGADNVGSTPTTQISSSAENTVALSGVSQVGAQSSPANDTFLHENFYIPYRDISDEYEVYVATQGSASVDITGELNLQQLNHQHDTPRQDDFDDSLTEVGAGAENKDIPYTKAEGSRGDVQLDFSSNDEQIVLDTTLKNNEVKVTFATEAADGSLTNKETISANNSEEITSTFYQDDELVVEINSASDTQEFQVRDLTGDDVFNLSAGPKSRFSSSKESQQVEPVADDSGTETDLVQQVSTGLLEGLEANNYKVFIDTDPKDSTTNSVREITGLIYSGSNDSGKKRDKEKLINNRFDIISASSNQFVVSGDKTGFIQSGDKIRIFESKSNDGDFTVSSVTYDSVNNESTITVNESVSSASDGVLEHRIVDGPGWYQLQLEPDQPTFTKARVYLEHHKDAS